MAQQGDSYEGPRRVKVPWFCVQHGGLIEENDDLRRAGTPQISVSAGAYTRLYAFKVLDTAEMLAVKIEKGMLVSLAPFEGVELMMDGQRNPNRDGDAGDEGGD